MLRGAWLMFALAVVMLPQAASAASVDITGDEPRRAVTIVAEDSTVEQVLQALASKYGFKIKGIEHAGTGEALSATISGSLHEVVTRLLRNWNYMVVRSPDNASGIERVMILDASYGTARSKFMAPSGNGADELMQALSGGATE